MLQLASSLTSDVKMQKISKTSLTFLIQSFPSVNSKNCLLSTDTELFEKLEAAVKEN